jgi:hypothetical protein
MTWMSKRETQASQEPQICARCRMRPGTTLLHFTNNPANDGNAANPHVWLCDECKRELSQESREN